MSYLIYGAYGYTGTLIARHAVREGHQPVLAGRDEATLRALASSLDLDAEVVGLDESTRLRAVLQEVSAVLHCAGPFVHTSRPMIEACLDTGTHYLDLTGEIPVLQALAARDEEATQRDVVVLPAVGFDVVPTDCLARALSEELPSATLLEIAFAGMGRVSKGTLKTAVQQLGSGGKVRRNGAVTTVPPGWTTRTVDFGDRSRRVMSIPWGDVVTAGHSTGIPNVTVYAALPPVAQTLLRLSRYVQGLLAWPPLQTLLTRAVDRWGANPTDEDRRRGTMAVWASIRTGAGERRTVRLRGPDAYTLTARTAVEAVRRVVNDPPEPGYHTPSTAFGVSFVREIDGVEWLGAEGGSS